MSPGRTLRILGFLIPVFAIPYAFALQQANKRAGIWTTLITARTEKRFRVKPRASKKRARQLLYRLRLLRVDRSVRPQFVLAMLSQLCVFRISLYFSLLSAFHLGYQELNIGEWITRLQCRNYTMSATGWARTVAGLQSLISVYLLALWVLTYFGRPFE